MQLFRFSALGTSLHSFARLPDGVTQHNLALTAEDGGESQGVLYTRGGEHAVVHFMHPRGDQSRHYAMPALLEAGFAVFGHAGRYLFNDSDFVYERLLFDVAAASVCLRERGFRRVIGLGNSGGGTLFAFYQGQAATRSEERLRDTAAGEPCALGTLTMPPLDGIVHLATHLGQGKLMLDNIDPSVLDEHDPLSCDRTLDMFDEDHGFRVPPTPTRYEPAFIARYRAAQQARVRRIDAIAQSMLDEAERHRMLLEDPSLSPRERLWAERRAALGRYLQVYRTQANPALADLSLAPNRRAYGSFYSARPDVANHTLAGFGKFQTPRAWLSTWSAFHSRGSTLRWLPRNELPTLVVAFTGDNMIFPGELETLFAQSPASDKQLVYVDADHFGHPLPEGAQRGGRDEACARVVEFLAPRFL